MNFCQVFHAPDISLHLLQYLTAPEAVAVKYVSRTMAARFPMYLHITLDDLCPAPYEAIGLMAATYGPLSSGLGGMWAAYTCIYNNRIIAAADIILALGILPAHLDLLFEMVARLDTPVNPIADLIASRLGGLPLRLKKYLWWLPTLSREVATFAGLPKEGRFPRGIKYRTATRAKRMRFMDVRAVGAVRREAKYLGNLALAEECKQMQLANGYYYHRTLPQLLDGVTEESEMTAYCSDPKHAPMIFAEVLKRDSIDAVVAGCILKAAVANGDEPLFAAIREISNVSISPDQLEGVVTERTPAHMIDELSPEWPGTRCHPKLSIYVKAHKTPDLLARIPHLANEPSVVAQLQEAAITYGDIVGCELFAGIPVSRRIIVERGRNRYLSQALGSLLTYRIEDLVKY